MIGRPCGSCGCTHKVPTGAVCMGSMYVLLARRQSSAVCYLQWTCAVRLDYCASFYIFVNAQKGVTSCRGGASSTARACTSSVVHLLYNLVMQLPLSVAWLFITEKGCGSTCTDQFLLLLSSLELFPYPTHH